MGGVYTHPQLSAGEGFPLERRVPGGQETAVIAGDVGIV